MPLPISAFRCRCRPSPRLLRLRIPRHHPGDCNSVRHLRSRRGHGQVESAEAAGDEYPTTRVLTADGVVSLIGCLMGNPFINAVYIGHPGWKRWAGDRLFGGDGIMVCVSWFGIISVLVALVPVVAISPILLYIGMLIARRRSRPRRSSMRRRSCWR